MTGTMASSSSSVQIMVVEKFEVRKVRDTGRQFLFGTVLESSEHAVKFCYVNNVTTEACRELLGLEPRSKVVISNVMGKGGSSLRVSDNAIVFVECVDFEVDMDVVESFIRPDTVTVSEARGSPKKRRLTVEGELVEVGALAETETYKRRVLKLGEPGHEDHTINLTVWGDEAVMERSPGVEITATAVVRADNGLNGTASTKIQTRESGWQQGTVVAVKKSGNHVDAMLDGNRCVRISEDLLVDFGDVLSKEIAFKLGEGNVVTVVELVE